MAIETRLLKYGLLGCLSGFILLYSFNYAVNPYWDYSHDWGRLQGREEINLRSRKTKLNLLQRLDFSPQFYILGNSRSMIFPPEPIEAQTGLQGFNLGVLSASIYDFLALTRWVLANAGTEPEFFILTLDSFTFRASLDEELYSRPLVSYLPEAGLSEQSVDLARFRRNLSIETFSISLNLLQTNLRGDPPSRYLSDGVYLPELGSGFHPESYAIVLEAYKTIGFVGPDPLPAASQALFEDWLGLLQDEGICLVIVLPPLYTPLVEVLAAESDYQTHMQALRRYLGELDGVYGFEWYDFSTVDRFGGDDRWFTDGSHFMPPLAELILEQLSISSQCIQGPDESE
jgi:hypothetical protein